VSQAGRPCPRRLAPTIAFQQNSSANLKVYTFAAPSPGDADFAEYYNALLG
jgi:hypothetical protein